MPRDYRECSNSNFCKVWKAGFVGALLKLVHHEWTFERANGKLRQYPADAIDLQHYAEYNVTEGLRFQQSAAAMRHNRGFGIMTVMPISA
jgi:hypothetical protein